MEYLRRIGAVTYISDIYDLPGVDSGYGFSIGNYGADLKDEIINYDTILTYLYDDNIDVYHKDLLKRPLILRVTDRGMPSFEMLYTDDEIKDIIFKGGNKPLRGYGIHYISDGVKWYRYLTPEESLELHKVFLYK